MPFDVLPLKVYWHGKTLPFTGMTLNFGDETRHLTSLLEPITFDGDQGTLRLVVTANGRRGKAWVPVDGIKCGRTDVEYIALVDDDGGPVGDLHVIFTFKPRARPQELLLPQDSIGTHLQPSALNFEEEAHPPRPAPTASTPVRPLPPQAHPLPAQPAHLLPAQPTIIPAAARGEFPIATQGLLKGHTGGEHGLVLHQRLQDRLQALQPVPAVSLVVREVRQVPRVDAPLLVELAVTSHLSHTSAQPMSSNGVVVWNEAFQIGIDPEDDLIFCLTTEAGGVVGSGAVKGEKLMSYKAHDVLVGLGDAKGRPVGSLLVAVGGGTAHILHEFGIAEVRERNMPYDNWLQTLADRNQFRTPRPLAYGGPPASWLPAPPQVGTVGGRFVVERVPTDRRLRQGTHTVERPWHGRGLCLRVLELKGRSPGGLHLQIQDAELLQQASVEDALNAYFTLEMAEDEAVTLRLLHDSDVLATGRFLAAHLLQSAAPVEVALYGADGRVDCEVVLERLADGPLGYSFGSREEMLAAPSPIVLR